MLEISTLITKWWKWWSDEKLGGKCGNWMILSDIQSPLLCLMVTTDSCTVTTKSGSAAQSRDLIFIHSLMKYSNRRFYHSTIWPACLPPSLSVFLWSLCALCLQTFFFFWHLIILGSDLNSTMQCLCIWLHVKEPFCQTNPLFLSHLSLSQCIYVLSASVCPPPTPLPRPSCVSRLADGRCGPDRAAMRDCGR